MPANTFEFQFGNLGFLPPEAEFIRFCFEKRAEIEMLTEKKPGQPCNFWDFRKGQAICHRDDKGKLRKIDFNLLG